MDSVPTRKPLTPFARMAIVFAAMIVGVVANHVVILSQIGFGLPFGALIAVSFATVWAVPLGAANLAVAAMWLWPYRLGRERAHQIIVFVNRQVGHFEFFGVWTIVAVSWKPYLYVQLPLVCFVLLFGEIVVDAVTRVLDPNAARASRGDFLWMRRPVFYLGTVLGGVMLVALAPAQVARIAPLFIAIGAGAVLRFVKLGARKLDKPRPERAGDDASRAAGAPPDRRPTEADRASFRRVQAGQFLRHDKWVPRALVAALVLAAGIGVLSRWHTEQQTPPPGGTRQIACAREPGGPVGQPDLGLFIVSDTQLHELRGPRYEGQVDLMGAFVPVAVRPPELDTLSAPTLLHFRDMYRDLHDRWRGAAPLAWTHLGDFADSGCRGELRRFGPLFTAFAAVGPLAGIAPGNHDSAFTGNFGWHPDWDVACPSGDLDKTTSDGELRRMLEPLINRGGGSMLPLAASGWRKLAAGGQTALATVAPLGIARDRWGERGVIAIFLDTSDRVQSDLLIAGSWGDVSDRQIDAVKKQIDKLQADRGGGYQREPAYLVLLHHPLAELTRHGRANVLALGAALDGMGPPGARPHLLGFISAHTHVSDGRVACVGGRAVRELVVGSTIDPPQEASLLTIGRDARDDLALRLRTIQSVDREGTSCADEPTTPTAAACDRLVGGLLTQFPECRPLALGALGPAAHRPCGALEQVSSLVDRVDAVAHARVGLPPNAIRESQWNAADAVLACICRATGCTPPADALDERRSNEVLNAVFDPDGAAGAGGATASQLRSRDVVTCLSWAAAAVQVYKAKGMTMQDALRCAFDDRVLAPAKELVASLDPDALAPGAAGQDGCR